MTESTRTVTPSTQDIARRGELIYRERYEQDFEKEFAGKFAAINVNTGDATVADSAEEAVREALEKDPNGLFHLVRVAHKAAFQAGWYMSSGL